MAIIFFSRNLLAKILAKIKTVSFINKFIGYHHRRRRVVVLVVLSSSMTTTTDCLWWGLLVVFKCLPLTRLLVL